MANIDKSIGAVSPLTYKALVDLAAEIAAIATDLAAHVHGGVTAGAGNTGVASNSLQHTPSTIRTKVARD